VQVPGYLEKQEALKAKGIDEVLVFCVNDGAVMDAWAKDQKIEGSMIKFLADPKADLTKALGMELTDPGPVGKLGHSRCKRHAVYLDDGVAKVVHVSEAPGDPAGDENPSLSCADEMLKAITELKSEL